MKCDPEQTTNYSTPAILAKSMLRVGGKSIVDSRPVEIRKPSLESIRPYIGDPVFVLPEAIYEFQEKLKVRHQIECNRSTE